MVLIPDIIDENERAERFEDCSSNKWRTFSRRTRKERRGLLSKAAAQLIGIG
jgi:hypothetical protein